MAVTVKTILGPQPAGIGNRHFLAIEVTATTYTAGGVAVAIPTSITQPIVVAQANNGYVAEWDAVNSKVKLYSAPETEVTTLSDAVTVTILFIGQ